MTNIMATTIQGLTKNVDFDAGPKIRHLLGSTKTGQVLIQVYDRGSCALKAFDNISLAIALSDGVQPSEAVTVLQKSIETLASTLGLPISTHPYWAWHKNHFEALKAFLDTAAEADALTALYEKAVSHAESMSALKKEASEIAGCATELLSRTLVQLRAINALTNQEQRAAMLVPLQQVWAKLAIYCLTLHTLASGRLVVVEECITAYKERRKKLASTNLGFIADYGERLAETARALYESKASQDPVRATASACKSVKALTEFTCRASDLLWSTHSSNDIAKTVSSIEAIKAGWEALKLHELAPRKTSKGHQ